MPYLQEEDRPFKLKDIYSKTLLQEFAAITQREWPSFPVDPFLNAVFDKTWLDLELKARTKHISTCLLAHLPQDFKAAVQVLTDVSQRLTGDLEGKLAFEYGFVADFLENFGVEQPDIAIPAMEKITRLTSAEFAVRPYLIAYPDRMYGQMLEWSNHENTYVRRLASEGFRPRLPWGMGIPVLKKDPSPILPVLENLKKDPAETVRRSVANNLNDISKDHPDLVLNIAQKWKGDNAETDWIVKHACRGLLKGAHPVALKLFGFETKAIRVNDLAVDKKVKIGDRLNFSFQLVNASQKSEKVRIEYAIHYITATGKISKKVFKIKEKVMEMGEMENLVKNQRFENFTTRKHYPGQHTLEILVNGSVGASTSFEVI